MSATQTIKVIESPSKEIWAPCSECSRQTAHKILAGTEASDESPGGDIQVWYQHYVVMCSGCKTVSFCEESQCSEETEYNDWGHEELKTKQRVYPGRIAGRPLINEVYDLPYGVGVVYRETHEAICNKQSVLAGIGVRAIVEAVCKERNASGPDLYKKIDELVVQGVITKDGGSVLHEIRMIGNSAAHEAKANSDLELTTALEVVENLLTNVYVIPKKIERMKKTKS